MSVSVSFLTTCVSHLTRHQGERLLDVDAFNAFAAALGEAERLWQTLPGVGEERGDEDAATKSEEGA